MVSRKNGRKREKRNEIEKKLKDHFIGVNLENSKIYTEEMVFLIVSYLKLVIQRNFVFNASNNFVDNYSRNADSQINCSASTNNTKKNSNKCNKNLTHKNLQNKYIQLC